MSNLNPQTVLSVHHWTDTLFSFTCTRDPSFRFENGQFTMVGLEIDGKPLMRAYSIASANYDEELEFFSIKVPHGPLTSRLQHLKSGDPLLIGRKPTGTLIVDNLLPGRVLWLLSTGTGLAPFATPSAPEPSRGTCPSTWCSASSVTPRCRPRPFMYGPNGSACSMKRRNIIRRTQASCLGSNQLSPAPT
jgi:hypothetical protein